MNDEAKNAYLTKLMHGGVTLTDEAELTHLSHFQQAHATLIEAQQRADRAQRELDQARVDMLRIEGRREAFADLLIAAEMSRRGCAATVEERQNDAVFSMLNGAEVIPALRKAAT